MQSKLYVFLFLLIFCFVPSLFAQFSLNALEISGILAAPQQAEYERLYLVNEQSTIEPKSTISLEANIRTILSVNKSKFHPIIGLGTGVLSSHISSSTSIEFFTGEPFSNTVHSEQFVRVNYYKATIGLEYQFLKTAKNTYFIRPLLDIISIHPDFVTLSGRSQANLTGVTISGDFLDIPFFFESEIGTSVESGVFLVPSLELGMRKRLNEFLFLQGAISGSYTNRRIVKDAYARLIGVDEVLEGTISQQFVKLGVSVGIIFKL